jgi:hypothetical protein
MSNHIIHRAKDLQLGRGREQIAGALEHVCSLSRRRLLGAGAAAACSALLANLCRADEAVKTGKFIFPRLQFTVYDKTPDIWNVGPVGDANLRKKLQELTNINVSLEPKVVKLGDFDDMVRNPFVFMTSEGYFRLPENEEKNLREFLERGCFIHADDCVYASKEDRFFRTYVALLEKLFPDNPMRKIPDDHEIYHIYFDMPKAAGRASPCPHMQGVDHGAYGLFERGTGRIMSIATPGDLHCGWMNKYWPYDRTLACIKMGINIIVYFLSH